MSEGEQSYVFYSQMVQVGHRGEREGGDRPGKGGGGATVLERKGLLECYRDHTHTYTLSLIYCTFTSTEEGLF